VFGTTVAGRWLNYPRPGILRLPDGKPNLSAPTPRTPDGKPDLSGLWTNDVPAVQFQETPLFELKLEDIILTPEGKALQRRAEKTTSRAPSVCRAPFGRSPR
jgi:hypothetical protein